MPLSPETEWTIVACGLIAHADGVLDGEECERLLSFIDDDLEADVYSEWLALVGDKAALEAKLAELPPPAPALHREVLEQAWSMAMVDGERCDAEVEQLQEIALAIGVEPMQLEFWRDAWTQAEHELSEVTAGAAVTLLAGAADGEELLTRFLGRLPTDDEHRRGLARRKPADLVTVGLRLTGLGKKPRRRALQLLAGLALDGTGTEVARGRFVELAVGAGLRVDEAEQLLRRAESRL